MPRIKSWKGPVIPITVRLSPWVADWLRDHGERLRSKGNGRSQGEIIEEALEKHYQIVPPKYILQYRRDLAEKGKL